MIPWNRCLLVALLNVGLAVSGCGPAAKTGGETTVEVKPAPAVAPEEPKPEGDWPIFISWKTPATARVHVSEVPNLKYRKIKEVDAKELDLVAEFIAKEDQNVVAQRMSTHGFAVSEKQGDLNSPKLAEYGLPWQGVVFAGIGEKLSGTGDMKVALFDGEKQLSNWLTVPITMQKPDEK